MSARLEASECGRCINPLAALLVWEGYRLGDAAGRQFAGSGKGQQTVHGDDRRVVVIGSGPAGAMAAHELVRNGIPVTLLESGEDIQRGALIRIAGRNLYRNLPPMTKTTGYIVTGDPETNLEYSYALGGISNQWTRAMTRLCAEE